MAAIFAALVFSPVAFHPAARAVRSPLVSDYAAQVVLRSRESPLLRQAHASRFAPRLAPSAESDINGCVTITYCTRCNWMLRSAWLAQELLSTFGPSGEVRSVTLVPDSSGGVFTVHCDGELVWDRSAEQTPGFPEAKVLKQLVRDVVCPDRGLGHSDSPGRER